MSTSSATTARQHMLKSQILTGHILNQNLLDTLLEVPRENFIPPNFKGVAYVDDDISLGDGRFLLEPLAFAKMLEHADITKKNTVLDIGCGSGYSAAVVARLAAKVVAVEESPRLAVQATNLLAALTNITVVQAPLTEGAHACAPYDIILIEGSVEYIPPILVDQLKEGGRLFAFEQHAGHHIGTSGLNNLVEYKKIARQLSRTIICDTSVAKLAAFNKPVMFAF